MEIKIVLHVLKDGNKNSNVSFMVNYWPIRPQKGMFLKKILTFVWT